MIDRWRKRKYSLKLKIEKEEQSEKGAETAMGVNSENLEEKINELAEYSRRSGKIDLSLYTEYDVKRGLRDSSGQGVLTGLTEISDVLAFDVDENGEKFPVDGSLYYQGYNVGELIQGIDSRRFGFVCCCSANFRRRHSWTTSRKSSAITGTCRIRLCVTL